VCVDVVAVGSLTSSIVHPREVFKSALLSSCASIAFVHNHPSDDPNPSSDDFHITKKLQEAGKIIGIPVLDHVIIGSDSYISMMEKGYISS
jgi:DNA repair protein RadC